MVGFKVGIGTGNIAGSVAADTAYTTATAATDQRVELREYGVLCEKWWR